MATQLQEHKTSDTDTGVKRAGVELADGSISIPDSRQDVLSKIGKLATTARNALPGNGDILEKRANELVAEATGLASTGATSLEGAQNFLSRAKQLQHDTQAALAAQRNPWSIKTAAAQDSSRFNQVVTLSVPRNQAIDVHYNRATTNRGIEKGHMRLCPGDHGPIKSAAGELWRQPDPNKPDYDTITIATHERHCERTRCGGIQREAFRGFITVKDPCASTGFHVNINNGAKNEHLTSESGVPDLNISADSLLSPEARYDSDSVSSAPEIDALSPSPGDDWQAKGFESFEAYLASFDKRDSLPSEFSVARSENPLKVVLKPGESLHVYQDSSLQGSMDPSAHSPEESIKIGVGAAEARLSQTLPGGGKEYEIRPGSRPSSQPYHFKIIRPGGGPDGLGFEVVAESRVYLGTDNGPVSSSPNISSLPPTSTPAKIESDPTPITELDAVLPQNGSYASVSKPLTIQLGTGPLQVLNIYPQGESTIGTVLSTSQDNSWEFSRSDIRMERDTSTGAPDNRFHLYADDSLKEPRTFTLSVTSPAAPSSVVRSTITAGPDVAEPKKKQEPAVRTRTRLAAADDGVEPISITVAQGEGLLVNYKYGDETTQSRGKTEIQGDIVSVKIPNVGRVSRKSGPDGKDVITIVPEEGFKGEISTKRSSEKEFRLAS
jgi:hypothetical protein